MGQTQGCIDHFHNKACKKHVVMRDEGGHGVITIAIGLWVDEEREVLWWQHPRKLGRDVCKCEECIHSILQGREAG